MHARGLLGSVKGAQRHAIAVIMQRWKTDCLASRNPHFKQFGQLSEAPRGQPMQPLLDRTILWVLFFFLWLFRRRVNFCATEALGHLLTETSAQLRQAARLTKHSTVLVNHAVIHQTMRRKVFRPKRLK